MVVHAVGLRRSPRPGGDADRAFQLRLGGQQGVGNGGLAGTGGSRQDQADAPACDLDHSMFCTCSRSCSIAAFSFRPVAVRAEVADLLHRVLASRLNSWIRKSSLRPILTASRSRSCAAAMWLFRRSSSSRTSE